MPDSNVLAAWVIFAGMPGLAVFVVIYALRKPWRNIAGRAVLGFSSSLLMLYLLGFVNSLYGLDWPYRGTVRLIVFVCVTGTIYYLLWTLIRIIRGRLPGMTITPDGPVEWSPDSSSYAGGGDQRS